MARILITWELGGGLGHLAPLVPLARELATRGHAVSLATRELAHVDALFGGLDVRHFQAPIKTTRSADRMDPPRTFAHILHNSGFSDPGELAAMAGAWRNLYELLKPDVILFDHSPLAMLASRAVLARRAVIGTGFCCPPDVYPLPDFRPWLPEASESLRRDEDHVLGNMNGLLASWRLAPLERLSQLYREVEATFLTTFVELDNYASERTGAEYFGVWSTPGGRAPRWPNAPGKRIFAYLKPFPAVAGLLEALQRERQPAIVFLDPLDPKLRARFESPGLRFETEPLDLSGVGASCDVAILNGGHGSTASMLLAGKPLLEIPLYLEQALNAGAVVRLGAGLSADLGKPEEIASKLAELLQCEQYGIAARQFAARYMDFKPQESIENIVGRMEKIV